MPEVLVLGPEGSGKSLLIRRIQDFCRLNLKGDADGDDTFASESTIPTIGVDISSIIIDGLSVDVREIGAAMASRWETYLPQCDALMFVVDISDMGSLSSTLVLLYEVLSYQSFLAEKPISILFNKTDLCEDIASEAAVFENVLRLEELRQTQWPDLILLVGSSLELESLPKLAIDWIGSYVLDLS